MLDVAIPFPPGLASTGDPPPRQDDRPLLMLATASLVVAVVITLVPGGGIGRALLWTLACGGVVALWFVLSRQGRAATLATHAWARERGLLHRAVVDADDPLLAYLPVRVERDGAQFSSYFQLFTGTVDGRGLAVYRMGWRRGTGDGRTDHSQSVVAVRLPFVAPRVDLAYRAPLVPGRLVQPGQVVATGHRAFDETFRVTAADPAFALTMLDEEVRAWLLAWQATWEPQREPTAMCRVRLEGAWVALLPLVDIPVAALDQHIRVGHALAELLTRQREARTGGPANPA